MTSTIVSSALIFLMIQHAAATDDVSFGSTRGCSSACQKECIEVINKYRSNHDAKEVRFSQFLANKAQRWADGGKFGYDMKSRGKYGQLIEWDVKDELQNFTTVVKHWHDKERDFDFASGRSTTGKTLHDFTQIVWKKAKKAGCGESEIFGSKYYVVWMDSDGVVGPNMEVGTASIGSPQKNDLHWFEPEKQSLKRKPTYVVPLGPQVADSFTRGYVEPEAPINMGRIRSEQSKPAGYPDLNEVREEQRVLNNNALLKQYLNNDSLNNVVLNENKETASYHVVSRAEDSANWQKGAETLIQLGKNKVNASQTSPNHDGMTSPVGDGGEDDSKQAARFQSLVIQNDDMLTKDEGVDNGTISSEASDSDDMAEGEEYQQATIQSMMKQEDDMIQNQEPEDDEESSGDNSTAGEATSGTSTETNTVVSNNDMSNSSSKPSAKSNESSVMSKTENHQQEKPTSFYTSGVALNNNPNETNTSNTSHDKPSFGVSQDKANSSLRGNEMKNQSSIIIQPETPIGSFSQGSLGIEKNENKGTGVMEPSRDSLLQNDKTTDQMAANVLQSVMLNHDNMPNQETTKQQSQSKGRAPASSVIDTGSNSSSDEGRIVNMASNPKASSSQGEMMPVQKQSGGIPILSKTQPQLTLTNITAPGATTNPNGKSPYVSQVQTTHAQVQQTGPALVNQRPASAASGSLKNENLMVVSNTKPQTVESTASNATIQSPIVNGLKASSPNSDLHHVTSPALITLPSASSRPIKLVFHVQDIKSQGMSPNTPVAGSQGADDYQSASVLNDSGDKMNNEECHDDTLQCQLWAHHGHCKGIAYAEFMRRHCKATCGYCGLPSVIKQSANHKNAQRVTQDEPCEDEPNYEFSCPRWRAQGYCEKRENEMKEVCRKTCGFCVSAADGTKSRHSTAFQHSPLQTGPVEGARNNGEVKVPILSKPLASLPAEPNQNVISNDEEPCEDDPNFEFSCPRWRDQGYCKKKEEMRKVCRKTCGFCVPAADGAKSRHSTELQDSPLQTGPVEGDGNNGEVKLTPILSKPLASLPAEPNQNVISNDQGKLTPSFDVQKINISPLKPKILLSKPLASLPAEPNQNDISNDQGKLTPSFDVQAINISPLKPKISLLNIYKPFVWSLTKQQLKSNATNTTEASTTSSQNFHNEQPPEKPESLPLKNQADEVTVVGLKNLSHLALKSVGHALSQNNNTLDQKGLKTPSSLPRGQGVANKLNNFLKRPVNIKPQLAVVSANNKLVSQKYRSEEEDKLIREGIKALQQRLQAPVEISAVAKSNPGCGQRLCKEKVKTQQAKTRETIGNQAPGVISARKTEEKLVSTTGCDVLCQQECLAAHNRYRLNHDASPLVLDQKLADQAQQWANKKVFKHSPWAGGQGGETIALGSLYPSFTAAVKAWHDEEKDYDWPTGAGIGDMKVNHFTQVVWKGAHLLGCGKTFVNGEPYYIAQMDTPGVIAGVPGYDKSNVGEPKEPDLNWFMDSSPYWKEMQAKDAIPKNIEHRIL